MSNLALGAKISIFVIIRILAVWLIWFGWRCRNSVDRETRLTGGLISVGGVLPLAGIVEAVAYG